MRRFLAICVLLLTMTLVATAQTDRQVEEKKKAIAALEKKIAGELKKMLEKEGITREDL